MSAIALPGCAEAVDGAVNLTIRPSEVPFCLPGGTDVQGCFQNADEQLLIAFPDAGRFLISRDEVVYEKAPHATNSDVAAVLTGIVLAVVLQLKNRFALHASAVEWNGKAVLFCGLPGTGKSILAAAMLQKGARLISDDLTCLSLRNNLAFAAAGLRALSLWPDSLRELGYRSDDYSKLRPAVEKRMVPHADAVTEEVPVGTVFFLLRRSKHDSSDCLSQPKPCDSLALFGNAASPPLFITKKTAAFPHFDKAAIVANQAVLHVLERKYRKPDLEETLALVTGALAANRNPPPR
jgi:hypothetical protein